jgi:hypothetical protein
VGLSYCNGTSNEWVACDLNRGTNTVTGGKPCWCPQTSRTVAFHDASRLANQVSLGTATGESVTWQGGFIPSSTSAVTSSSSSVAASSGASDPSRTSVISAASGPASGPASAPTSQPLPYDPEASSLSTGAKAGIGIGAGAVAIALAVLLFALVRRFKRTQMTEDEQDTHPTSAQPVALYNNSEAPEGDLRSPCWSGHKSELDAVGTASPSPRYGDFDSAKSEAEGSPTVGSNARPLTNGGFEIAGQKGPVYEMPAY